MKDALEVLYGANSITIRSIGFNPDHVVSYDYAEDLTPEQAAQVGVTIRSVICVDFVNGQTKFLLGTPSQFFSTRSKKTLLTS